MIHGVLSKGRDDKGSETKHSINMQPTPSQKPILGIILLILAMLLVPFMDAIAKSLSSHYPVLQLVWSRFFFHFVQKMK